MRHKRGVKLGEGGSGEVYASDETRELGEWGSYTRPVAVKTLHGSARTDERAQRFAAECLIGYELTCHPNLVPTRDFCVTEREAWHVSDLVGPTVGQLLEEDLFDFPAHFVRLLVIDIVTGLERMHRTGFLHGDVTDRNVFVGLDGYFKLGDFGRAVPLDDLGSRASYDYQRLRTMLCFLLGCFDHATRTMRVDGLDDDLRAMMTALDIPTVQPEDILSAVRRDLCVSRDLVAQVARDSSLLAKLPERQNLRDHVERIHRAVPLNAQSVVSKAASPAPAYQRLRLTRLAAAGMIGALAVGAIALGLSHLTEDTAAPPEDLRAASVSEPDERRTTPLRIRTTTDGKQVLVDHIEWDGSDATIRYCVYNGTDRPVQGAASVRAGENKISTTEPRAIRPGKVEGGEIRVDNATDWRGVPVIVEIGKGVEVELNLP